MPDLSVKVDRHDIVGIGIGLSRPKVSLKAAKKRPGAEEWVAMFQEEAPADGRRAQVAEASAKRGWITEPSRERY